MIERVNVNRSSARGKYVLKDFARKYYEDLDAMIEEMAQKCTGGEEARLGFPAGSITIKLK